MDVTDLVNQYGVLFYPLVFLWTFIEGETIVLLSGAVARTGSIDPYLLVLCAWLGSFLGDQLWFYLSRRYGRRLIARYPSSARSVSVATNLLEKHATLFILFYRFIYGVRNVASLALGLSEVRWKRFLILNFIASGIWSISFVLIGWFAGMAIKKIFGEATQTASFVIIGIIIIVFAYTWIKNRIKNT